MGKYNEELVKAGVMLAGEGLHPSSKGARVRFSGDKRDRRRRPVHRDQGADRRLLDLQVRSREEAIEWVKRCPNPMPASEAEIEIRQVFDADDFGDALHARAARAGRAAAGANRAEAEEVAPSGRRCRGLAEMV